MNKFDRYDKYLNNHIENVKRAYYWIIENLPTYDFVPEELIENHDDSKYDPEEYAAYANYFYGVRTEQVELDFDYAWNHHQKTNPHHWQYWILIEDGGRLNILDMPHQYIIEMVCDWWAFSWSKNNLYEIFDWYKENYSNIVLSQHTRKIVDKLLDHIKNKLDELGVNNG